MALLHLDLRRRHSLHAWSAKPRGVSRSPKAAPRFRSLELKPASETLMSPPGEELSSMVIRGEGEKGEACRWRRCLWWRSSSEEREARVRVGMGGEGDTLGKSWTADQNSRCFTAGL